MSALVLFGTLFILIVIGVPIALSLGVTSMVTMLYLNVPLTVVAQRTFTALDSYAIMAIPLFILAGNLMTTGGISRRLVVFINNLVGRVRGGMAHAIVVACAFFAALSGSGPATVIAIGSTLYPEIVKLGYPKERCAGLLAVAGSLGPIIPPSIALVVYATIVNCSVGHLFTAGLIAGIMVAGVLLIVCAIYAKKENWPRNETRITSGEMFMSFIRALPALGLPIIILGGIYSGYLTPTESASIAVIYAYLVGVFLYREMSHKKMLSLLFDSAKNSAMILFIIATSSSFSWIFTYSGISRTMTNAIIGMNMSATVFCIAATMVFLFFGFFLEGIAMLVLFIPVVWPIAESLGVNVIHFGMIIKMAGGVGAMTPPVAVNVFAAASVSGLKIGEIAKGQLPFFLGFMMVLVIIQFFPWFSTFFI